jgi:hypothetical protein
MKSWRAPIVVLAAGFAACVSKQPPPMPAAFENAGARLVFTLDLPNGTGPFPAVVLGHGSGRVTRDQLKFTADRFLSAGFAVLRFDKSDIEAGVRFLRTRPEIDPHRIGISGWSQAGWILPIVARDLGDVAFMVIMSGPVCSVGLEMYYSDFAEETTTPLDLVYPKMREFTGSPGFDVVPTLKAIDTPGLWLFGSEDRSIPERDSIANLKALVAAGKPFEWKEYPGLDHPLSFEIWDDVSRWVSRFTR